MLRHAPPNCPPNSLERRENPATGPGLDSAFLAFLSGEGGFEPPVPLARHNSARKSHYATVPVGRG